MPGLMPGITSFVLIGRESKTSMAGVKPAMTTI
ncbi:hypothetical protein ACVILK_001781 [Bradyrhizobium embrapense]